MKRTSYSRFLARAAVTLLAVLFSFTGARAQETVTIGDGTVTSNYNPIGTYYNYSITEQLYTAEEIGMAGTISSISFYYMGIAAKDLPITMYMKHVDEADLASAGITLADADEVFSGTLSVPAEAGWVTITLDTPFAYDGTSNLLIGFIKDYLYYFSGQSWQCTETNATMARCTQSDSAGPYTTSTVPGTAQANRPNIQIEITPGSASSCERPTNLVATVDDAHSATLTWESEVYDYIVEYKLASLPDVDGNWTAASEEDIDKNEFKLVGLLQNTTYNARVQAVCDPDDGENGYSAWKKVTFTTPVSCPAPTDLAVTLTPGNGSVATLAWTENGNPAATSWQICLNDDEENLIDAATNPFQLTGLTPETAYTAKVRAVGDGEFSSWTDNITFTPSDAYSITVYDGTTTNNYVPYVFYFDDFTKSQYIIPATDLTDMEYGTIKGIKLYTTSNNIPYTSVSTVDVYLMEVNNTTLTAYEPKANGTIVYQGTLDFVAEGTGGLLTINFTTPYTYEGGNLLVGFENTTDAGYKNISFYGQTVEGASGSGSNGNSLDDVPFNQRNFIPKTTIDFTPGEAPACARPTDLAASEIGPRSVKLNWTENGTATAWQICLNDDETNLITADSNPFTLTGLTPETEYTAKVRATQDGDFSFWSKSVTFTTPVAFPAPTEVAAGEITQTSAEISWTGNADSYNLRYRIPGGFNYGFETAEPWVVDNFGPCTTYDGDGVNSYGISGYSMPNANYVGSVIAFSDNSQWAAHSGNVMGAFMDAIPNSEAGITANDDYFITPELTIADGDHFIFWARSVTDNYGLERMKVGIYGGNGTISTYFAGSASSYIEVPLDWTEFDYDLSAYAGQTIQLAINCVSADAFALLIDDIFVGNTGDNGSWDKTIANVTSPYTIEGLTPDTNYEVQVQAVYTGEYPGESRWTETTFSTLVEVPAPTALAASEVGARTAVLSWTENGEATAWEICLNNDEANPIAADSNPFTLTDLTPETEYTVKVRSVKGDKRSNWSSQATFTTEVAFPAPTELAVGSLTSHSANISWTGNNDATSYNLRYGMLQGFKYGFETAEPWAVDDFAPCTTYDGDGLETYYFNGWTFTNQGFTGACIAFQNGVSDNMTAHSGNAFGTMFNPANGSPANDWLILPEITIQDGDVFSFWAREITDSYGPEIINVGVYGSTDGTFDSYLAQGLQISGTTWTQYSYDLSAYAGQTIKLAVNCVSQDVFGFMIDDISVGGINEWNTITGVTSPYTIEGLAPETIYDVQVQAVYGTDGESSWVASGFTTLTDNPVPNELAADLTANSATLTWTGEGDSYNVRYRIASTSNELFYDAFEGAEQGDWTTSNLESQSGFQNGYFRFYYTTNPPQYLISPELSGLTTNETILEFYYQIQSSSYPETFEVGYSTTTNDIDAFTWSDEVTATNVGSWLSYTQMLPAGVKYFAIKCTSNDMLALYVSGFGIYEYTPESEWTTIAVTDAQATISGLATNNGYEYQVQSLKGDKTSDWSETGEFALLSLGNDATDISSLLTNNYGRQAHVTLANRNFAKGMWNTICLPFDLTIAGSAFEGATLKTFDIVESSTEEKISLKFTDALDAIEAGKPYIIKWAETASDIVPQFANVVISAYQGSSISNGGVNFTGNLDAFQNTGVDADRYIYYLTSGNTLKYYAGSQPRTMYSCRAFFDFSQLSSLFVASEKIRNITLDFGDGEVTGISDINSDTTSNGDWYNVNGMKLNQQPSRKGLYIQNGRKVVIK